MHIARRLTSELIARGLSAKCLDELPKPNPNWNRFKHFQSKQIALLKKRLPQACEVAKGLFHIGLPGKLHIMDAATLRFDAIQLRTGIVKVIRRKSGTTIRFRLSSGGLEWVKGRYHEGAVYIFPELIFKAPEKKLADYNRNPLPLGEIGRRFSRIAGMAHVLFQNFLREAGIPEGEFTYNSFRHSHHPKISGAKRPGKTKST